MTMLIAFSYAISLTNKSLSAKVFSSAAFESGSDLIGCLLMKGPLNGAVGRGPRFNAVSAEN